VGFALLFFFNQRFAGVNDISAILKSVGIEPQQEHLNQVVEALKGKNLHEV